MSTGSRLLSFFVLANLSLATQPAGLRPYSVQMHLHGSMSEGPGSMRGANVQARKLGLDVLWWSDHDWRVAYHTYAAGFDFESEGLASERPIPYPRSVAPELVKGQKMEITLTPHEQNGKVTETVARISPERASQGAHSLEVAAAGGAAEGGFQGYFQTIDATRKRLKRSLASGVKLHISIYPEIEVDKKTMAGVRIDLSQQPPEMRSGAIVYVLTGLSEAELKALETPHLRYVKLDFRLHQWNQYTLDPSGDARRLGLGGEDNALVAASFGVLTTGQRARAFFDDYRIEHGLAGEQLRAAARRMAAALEQEFGVANYVGQEFSYQAHLNPFGDVPMIDYAKHPLGLSAAETVDFVHRHGGVVSLNHYVGGSAGGGDAAAKAAFDKRMDAMIGARAFGADLMESNPRNLAAFLRVWDALSAKSVRVIATGVSDSHSSTGGWFTGNNWVSWIWARSRSIKDLVEGLRSGNVYFGDPVKFQGRLSLTAEGGHGMGRVVETSQPAVTVRIAVAGLQPGARIRTVAGGRYGKEFVAGVGDFEGQVEVDTTRPTFFRVETYLATGEPLVMSNPVYFTPARTSGR